MNDSDTSSETEAAIFRAALEVFSHKGKDGARMQEIADLACINKAMLHYYYRTKDGLYEAVLFDVMGRFMRALDQALSGADSFSEVLGVFIRTHTTFIEQQPAIHRLMMHENLGDASVAREHFRRALSGDPEGPPRAFIRRIREAVEQGEIRPVDPVHTFVSLLGACTFAFMALPTLGAIDASVDADPGAFLSERHTHVFDLFLHGLSPVTT